MVILVIGIICENFFFGSDVGRFVFWVKRFVFKFGIYFSIRIFNIRNILSFDLEEIELL